MVRQQTSQDYEKYLGDPDNVHKYAFKSEQIKQAVIHLLRKHEDVLDKPCRRILKKLPAWGPLPESRGEFVIAQMEKQSLQLDATLCLSSEGSMSFLADYPDLFPRHASDICQALRLFVKASPMLTTWAMLHLIADYNEICITDEGFTIESEIQESQAVLTVKTKPDSDQAKRCFSLFALLNSTEVFKQLPDQEILIEIMDLMRDSYGRDPSLQSEGMLITLVNSSAGFTLKFVQSQQNRIMLEAKQGEELEIRFTGDIPCHQNTQRQLFKLISLFFSFDKKDALENAWRFACIEAVSQVVADMPPRIEFEFIIAGKCWGAEFACNAPGTKTVAAKSQQVLKAGADSVDISPQGREIRLVKNLPQGGKTAEIFRMAKDLDKLEAQAVLQEVSEVKAKEADKRKIKMEQIYQQAIEEAMQAQEQKHDAREPGAAPRTLEEASKTKLLRGEKTPDVVFRKIKRATLIGLLCIFLLCALATYWIVSRPDPVASPLRLKPLDLSRPPTQPADDIKAMLKEDPRLPNPADKLVNEICYQLNMGQPLPQGQLNKILKKLHKIEKSPSPEEKNFLETGDFYNLKGRLYWYKLELDLQEEERALYSHLVAYKDYDLFKTNWVERWKKEALKALDRAEEKYREDRYRTSVRITLNPWKPDVFIYADRKNLSYATADEAIDDIQKVKSQVQRIKTDPWNP